MNSTLFELGDRRLWLYSREAPQILFIQPVEAQDEALTRRQWEAMGDCARPFALAAFEVKDWNRELSPWEAPPVFGRVPFGGAANETLGFISDRLLPALKARLAFPEDTAICLGGYSLAGLFALWAATRTPLFSGIAAVSPSVWFPGWIDYAKVHPILAETVYLSLGDREERTKNPLMARVGDCIREQYALLQSDHRAVLEWNPGNHFQNPEGRSAKAFCWLARECGTMPRKP